MPFELETFEVTGSWVSVSDPALSSNNTGPRIENVQGLVTFTPRLPRGAAFFVSDYLVSVARNTIQQVFHIANPSTGTWNLSHEGIRTVNLSYSANAAAVEAALEDLPGIGAGNVQVTTGASADSFDVEFINDLAEASVSPLSAQSSLYNSLGQACPIQITVAYQGTPEVIAPVAVVLPAITGRIRNGRLCTIDSIDSPGVELAANSPELNNQDPLIYDVSFSMVSYNGEDQSIAPFGFVAPTDSTAVCITSPQLQKVNYSAPLTAIWSPGTTAAKSNNWRLRSVG